MSANSSSGDRMRRRRPCRAKYKIPIANQIATPMTPCATARIVAVQSLVVATIMPDIRGELGMVLCSADRPCLRIPSEVREVYDVSGAGDTVTAFVAVALAAGATMQEAAVLANLAAGIEVGKPGVATVTPDELRAMLGPA